MSAHHSERCSRSVTVADSNLPLDLWRSVLCYLPAVDLCHCSSVCRSWRYVVASLDVSSWRRFYLASNGGKHPLWPRHSEGYLLKSWYALYREHMIASRIWTKVHQDASNFNCLMLPIRKKNVRRVIKVGPGRQYRSLRSALDVASKYDQISLAPGVYNEQFEVSSKIPFELVGEGSPGAVVLIMYFDQNAATGRFSNLVLRAPWFTGCVLKVSQGHLQVDHCWLEEGQVKVTGSATAHFSFCAFHQVSLCFSHVTHSVLENCDLDKSTVSVEGYPKEGFCSSYMRQLYNDWSYLESVSKHDNHYHDDEYTGSLCTTSSAFQLNKSEVDSIGVASIDCSTSASSCSHGSGHRDSIISSDGTILSNSSSFCSDTSEERLISDPRDEGGGRNSNTLNKTGKSCDNTSLYAENSYGEVATSSHADEHFRESHNEDCGNGYDGRHTQPSIPHPWSHAASHMTLPVLSISSRTKLTADNLPPVEDLEVSSEDSDGSSCQEIDEESSGQKGRISPPWSSDSESVLETKLEMSFSDVLRKNPDLVQQITDTKGPLIRNCCIHSGRGGVKVSQQGECRLEKSELRDLQYGVRCLQNAKVSIVENDIHQIQTSAIFVRLAAHGLILGNNIYCTNEAGIDVRRNAYPLIQCNRIHHSKRSGIAVLGSGSGTIKGNNIYQNREAGVCVLYRGDPYVVGNRICHGSAAGITISERGRGYIIDNYISNNRWGGIDIKNAANPKVYNNVICGGLADGVIVGHRGRGVIQANTIKGNEGCGVLVMGGQPLLQLNQIYNNNNSGICLMHDKESVGVAGHHDSSDSLSEVSDDLASLDSSETDESENQQSQLLYNTVFHNNGYGVLCHHSEALHLHGNAIHDNKDVGVFIKQEDMVELLSNSITSNSGVGVIVSREAKASLVSNGIYENKEHGIFIEGEAIISSNDIFCNGQRAIHLSNTSVSKIEMNRIHCPDEVAIDVTPLAEGHFHDNQLYPGKQPLATIGNKSRLKVEHNTENKSLGPMHHVQEWHLQDPPPRPNIKAPSNVLPQVPASPSSKVTRVVLPSESSSQRTSKLCQLL